MENNSLKSYALMCECAEHVARFGILSDFLKKGITDYYSYKSKNEELPPEEMEVLNAKYQEFQAFFKKMIIQRS